MSGRFAVIVRGRDVPAPGPAAIPARQGARQLQTRREDRTRLGKEKEISSDILVDTRGGPEATYRTASIFVIYTSGPWLRQSLCLCLYLSLPLSLFLSLSPSLSLSLSLSLEKSELIVGCGMSSVVGRRRGGSWLPRGIGFELTRQKNVATLEKASRIYVFPIIII